VPPAAIALSERVTTGGERELKDYLGFLKGGCSKYPLDLLRVQSEMWARYHVSEANAFHAAILPRALNVGFASASSFFRRVRSPEFLQVSALSLSPRVDS